MISENEDAKALEMRRAYLREWRAKNRDKVKTYNRTYWERKAARLAADTATEPEQQKGR